MYLYKITYDSEKYKISGINMEEAISKLKLYISNFENWNEEKLFEIKKISHIDL